MVHEIGVKVRSPLSFGFCGGRYEQQLAEEELEKLENETARKKREEESAKYAPNAVQKVEAHNPMQQLEADGAVTAGA